MKTTALSCIIVFILTCSTVAIYASPQVPDYVIYDNEKHVTYNLILEQYLQKQDMPNVGRLFGLSFREGASFTCWRGYQATYKIENDSLFLVDIITFNDARKGKQKQQHSLAMMDSIFGNKFVNGKVFIDWFDGDISFPLNQDDLLRWDGVFYRIYNQEKLLRVSNGIVNSIEDIENYIDDPQRIDRRYKDNFKDILYERLEEIPRETTKKANCSGHYKITIDENGDISNVATIYYSKKHKRKVIRNKGNTCNEKIYDVLKTLKFDIIKDKGKPISEDVVIGFYTDKNGRIIRW